MKIHNDLLTHNGVAANATGKVLDLGFNGDFDRKKLEWNMVFVQFPAKASGTDMTVKVYSVQSSISGIVDAGNVIGTVVVPAAEVQKGGLIGLPMPKGLKRYFTIGISGTTIPTTGITAGITDEVDTDLKFDWTNYKAATGSTEVPTRATRVGDVVSGAVDSRIKVLENA